MNAQFILQSFNGLHNEFLWVISLYTYISTHYVAIAVA